MLWTQESTHFDMTEFPLWARDLRRAEIVAFGSFPFAYFFTNFGYNFYRFSDNDWDRRYAPWPFTSAGAIEQSRDERVRVITLAAGGAVIIALVDYGIQRSRRNRVARQAEMYPEGTPIIIRRPINEENAEGNSSEEGDSP